MHFVNLRVGSARYGGVFRSCRRDAHRERTGRSSTYVGRDIAYDTEAVHGPSDETTRQVQVALRYLLDFSGSSALRSCITVWLDVSELLVVHDEHTLYKNVRSEM